MKRILVITLLLGLMSPAACGSLWPGQETPEELKATIGGEVLAIYTDCLDEAFEVVRSLPQVVTVAIFGNRLHAATTNLAQAREMVPEALEARQITIRRPCGPKWPPWPGWG